MKSKSGLPKFGGQMHLNCPHNAPKDSWWATANGDFYARAKAELPRMLISKIHHQIVAVRIVGQVE